MPDATEAHLIAVYRDKIRSFLETNGQDLTAGDQAVAVLESALGQRSRLSVGFVGESQVGKSSLINALLGRSALPAGGVGPLTASATRVRFATDPTLSVRYHAKKQLQQLAFAIETHLLRRGKSYSEKTAPPDDVQPDAVPPDPAEITGDDQGATEARAEATRKMSYMLSQAKRLLADSAAGAPESRDLTDELALEGLRAVLGFKLRCDASQLERYQPRIAQLKAKLGTEEVLRQSALGTPKAFDRELRLRAAGWLSPLVAAFDVGLDSELLRELDLVDLPGIGVVGDPAALEAQRFVTQDGGSLVLVMRNAGMTEELARLLERTGAIRRYLFGGRDGRAPIYVLIAVTHLDDVAREQYSAAVEEAGDDEPPSPDEIFGKRASEMAAKVREQIAIALSSSPSLNDLPADQRNRREAVVKQLCNEMIVECVAAPDFAALTYRSAVAVPGFLRTAEATGIPAFRRHLERLAAEVAATRTAAVTLAHTALRRLVDDHLAAVEQLYAEGGGQAQAAWDSFRADLEKSLHQLRPQMAAFQGEALAMLRGEVPRRIELLCANAEKVALTRLSRLRGYGKTLHYQSLNAALLRSGVWERKGIDYPDSLTSALVDTIATDWEPQIVEALRATLRDVANRSLVLVEKLCDEARKYDSKIVSDAQIDAQKRLLVQQSQTAVAWTRERLEELREAVQKQLYDTVLRPIDRACKEAVEKEANRHAGAKDRILEAFQEGGAKAVAKGAEKAKELLTERYKVLLAELNRGFLKEHHDPVQAAFEALTSETLARARRSDAQKRKRVLDGVADARNLLAELENEVEGRRHS
ncbi:dynamin family protein [Anaeromyxobacter oryzae]|uniref:Dynamin N-terminal domain-containing protein n=1 Tax=Anaeromyxobacter oryzae TaxID=2918170 RepID=A0ABN6MP57_9BACT|nr:dynamin family protein [Anaeromyxobacter oryzae]BDG02817.1 hypothetical protein AMOR_18130 [Anaeromyxobacter oryzae]